MTMNLEHPRTLEYPRVVSHAEWLAARKKFLTKEKEFTRLRDQVSAERRRVPMVKIEKNLRLPRPDPARPAGGLGGTTRPQQQLIPGVGPSPRSI
jgi:hypothetical protein